MRRFLAIAAALAAILLVSWGGDGGAWRVATTLAGAQQRGIYGVGVTTIELVDTPRPTAANGTAPPSNERKLTTEVWYPADPSVAQPEARDVPLDHAGGPYPLIVFAHGLSSTRLLSASYTQHLASHGYIVAEPDFPLSNLTTPGDSRLAAVLEQPKDVSFVIDSMLQFNKQSGHLLRGAIASDRIGLTGHSLGALTTMLTIYGPDRDVRIKAALPFAVPACFLPGGFAGGTSLPILVLSGTDDLITPPAGSDLAYDIAHSPRYLVHIAGADHSRFVDFDFSDSQLAAGGGLSAIFGSRFNSDALELAQAVGGDASACALGATPPSDPLVTGERQRELLRTVAVPFFDRYMRGSTKARDLLQKLPDQIPQPHLQSDLGK